MQRLSNEGIAVWHANFEPINTLTFFRDGKWRDWIIKGDLEKVQLNYCMAFVGSREVYNHLGLGFGKSNFLSKSNVKYLIKILDNILSRKRDVS